MGVRIMVGHVIDRLKAMPDNSVHCVVTSPPYWGLRDYGTPPQIWGGNPTCEHRWNAHTISRKGSTNGRSDLGSTLVSTDAPKTIAVGETNDPIGTAQYRLDHSAFCDCCPAWRGSLGLEPTVAQHVANIVVVFREIKRVLRRDGTLWLNYGDCFATSVNGRSAADAKIVGHDDRTFRDKPFSTVSPGLKPKDLVMMPAEIALALRGDGWWLRQDIIWAKANPMPESTTDRPTSSHEHLFLLTKSARYFYDAEAVKEAAVSDHQSGNGYNRDERLTYSDDHGARDPRAPWKDVGGTRNLRNVWNIPSAPFPEAHFATFPPALVEPCIKAGTSENGVCAHCGAPWKRETRPLIQADHSGDTNSAYPQGSTANRLAMLRQAARMQGVEYTGARLTTGWTAGCGCGADIVPATVLDPFLGSGTTALVADRLGRNAIGFELNASYATIAQARLIKDGGMLINVEVAA